MGYSSKKAPLHAGYEIKPDPFNQLMDQYLRQVSLRYQTYPIIQQAVREVKKSAQKTINY